MESKTIKISSENYIWLLNLASALQKRYGQPISFDEALRFLKNKKMKGKKISNLAGSWKMSEKEAEKLKEDLRKGWTKWKIPSA